MIKTGDVLTWSRTFTEEETLQFALLSGDQGKHHMEYDEQGRLMVHGLLTASIGTKIGGDLNYIARDMKMEFIRPVFTGDTIICQAKLTQVENCEGYKKVTVQSTYTNQKDKQVLLATSSGIVRD
jgi:acyl dehydratase